MAANSVVSGGTSALQGYDFQAYSLVYYLLLRLQRYPSLRMEVETDEDAVIQYSGDETDSGIAVCELVQCKKRQRTGSEEIRPGYNRDPVQVARLSPTQLRRWIEAERGSHTVAEVLASSSNTVFTALLLTEPSRHLGPFQPGWDDSPNSGLWALLNFNDRFPADFQHNSDPVRVKKHVFSTAEVRKRIRALFLPSWTELRVACTLFLQDVHGIPRENTEQAVSALIQRYTQCALASKPPDRVLIGDDVQLVVDEFRAERRQWIPASDWLERENLEPSEISAGETLRWCDFEANRYVRRPQYDEALRGLSQDGFVLLHGHPGSGKSTLAKFLMYQYLRAHPEARGYYLSVHADFTLTGAEYFLESQLATPTLFVVDDEQFSHSAIKDLLAIYMDARLTGRAQAKVVVTSTTTYSRKMLGERKSQDNPLTYAAPVRFEPVSETEFAPILERLQDCCDVELPLPSQDIARLSGGRFGLALIIIRAAADLPGRMSLQTLTNNNRLHELLREWVLEKTGLTGTPEVFDEDLLPIFLITSFGIGLPRSFNDGMESLQRAGFLDQIAPGEYVAELSLSYLLNRPYQSRLSAAFGQLLSRDPRQIVSVARRLASAHFGQPALKDLCRTSLVEFAATLADEDLNLNLGEVATVFDSVFSVSRPQAKRLFREIGEPGGALSRIFYDLFCQLDRIRTPSMVASFFAVLLRVDRYLTRRLAREGDQLGVKQAEVLVAVFSATNASLDDIAAAQRSIYRCSSEFALYIADQLENAPSFRRKIHEAESDISGLPRLLKYCVTLYFTQRERIGPIVDRNFTAERMESLFLVSGDQNAALICLQQLRRLRPRTVVDTLARIWQRHRNLIASRCLKQDTLVDYTTTIYFLGRLNRRVARAVAEATKEHAKLLVSRVTDYQDAGSEFDTLDRVLGWKHVNDLAQSIDREAILRATRNETHRFVYLGKALRTWGRVAPELGSWLEKRLSLEEFMARVSGMHLLNLTYLLNGFLHSVSVTEQKSRSQEFMESKFVRRQFEQAWKAERSLNQATLCIHLLSDTGLSKDEVRRLVGHTNDKTFEQDIRSRFERESSLVHIVNGLYQFANFSPKASENALIDYVKRFTAQPSTASDEQVKRYRQRAHTGRVSTGFRSNNLVDTGALLRIAAAINPDQALELAQRIDLDRFIAASREETNLGRMGAFISGLHEASRQIGRDFLEETARPMFWEDQLRENEHLGNVLLYGRVLSRTSKTKGKDYIDFVVEQLGREIVEFVSYQANVMEVSNWLRALRVAHEEVVSEHVTMIVPALREASEFDLQLRHLLEAAEALAEWREYDEGRRLAHLALTQLRQVKSIVKLRDLVVILQKAIWLEEQLRMPGFVEQLFSPVNHAQLPLMFIRETFESAEDDPILAAFAVFLLDSVEGCGLTRFL